MARPRPVFRARSGFTPAGICVKLSEGVPDFGVILAFAEVVATVAREGFVQGLIVLIGQGAGLQDADEAGRVLG